MQIKKKLESNKVTIGSWMQIPSPDVAEVMGKAGYDWIAVDLEHGNFSNQLLPDIFRAIELGGTLPIARVAETSQKEIKQALDAGAKGLILPMITETDQLLRAISWAYYPPKGTRGVGYSRANLFGKEFDSYIKNAALDILIVAQIEHIDAVNNLDNILSVESLNAIIIGPYDLYGSMGITGNFKHPDFVETLQIINRKAKAAGIACGFHIVQPDRDILQRKIEEGYQFIAYGIDTVFLYRNSICPKI